MKIRFKKEALLYDIANISFVIADIHPEINLEALHQLQDVCQGGNLDRVARILGLAFSRVTDIMAPILKHRHPERDVKDRSADVRDYILIIEESKLAGNISCHKTGLSGRLSADTGQNIRNIVHEYLVCRVVADRLSVVMPALAGVWREKAAIAEEALSIVTAQLLTSQNLTWRRNIHPF